MEVTALKTFVGKAGLIKAGTRFETDDLHVKQLERNGLVSRHEVKPMEPETKGLGEDEALLAELRARAAELEIPNANRMKEATLRERIAEAEKPAGDDGGAGEGEGGDPDPDAGDDDDGGNTSGAGGEPDQPELGEGEQGEEGEASKS
ncbi:hypothetical protein QO259_05625 [Salinicola sp. JS01]|uniref:hypothetical protein n=1 Tax=Salinicola sp. JS01 TaxID=3050071 RepID=UPI00255C2127|nr:hypothetical protein [Salinicola sp. JS01]WIX34142.1 hypothetical protein QO259_05625 [Salinicola sp. JS01]